MLQGSDFEIMKLVQHWDQGLMISSNFIVSFFKKTICLLLASDFRAIHVVD